MEGLSGRWEGQGAWDWTMIRGNYSCFMRQGDFIPKAAISGKITQVVLGTEIQFRPFSSKGTKFI